MSNLLDEVFTPLNIVLSAIIAALTWTLFGPRKGSASQDDQPAVKILPKMKRRDMTVVELREFDGTPEKNDGRILVAVNGTVFDVTRASHYYGPGGPYAAFAGRDASRMLATFCLKAVEGPPVYDDLSDLKSSEMDQVKEWFLQFKEKYDVVGKLLKPGDEPTDYSDNEEATDGGQNTSTEAP
ncbi:membrane-associated progesterone receptor component 2 [Galendromus occidentalis]|uniref:Membrane-associated progesterone receptor component 2 n=1 Tax=Galendromus occidentalis TaxID=34638 RepID=A0AAJ6VWB1_9ACAR|nr:membrane-associated progesterone receptor component 2 [Galendromus occidentalis]XP_018493822.1 membrane-associated progesterone receptor component 2 [Galendromus occidentalis]